MDKRKEENLRVKLCITDALFSLMAEKSLSDIHITELVEKAGVARASFYRNYSSKENVLVTLIQDVLAEFHEKIVFDQGNFYTFENILLSFRYFQKYKRYILDLRRSGFLSVLLDEMNRFHENIEGNMPYSSIEKYELYLYIGALMNTGVTWLLDDDNISCEDIADYFFKAVSGMRKRQVFSICTHI